MKILTAVYFWKTQSRLSSGRPQAFVRKKFENIVSFVLIHIFIELENYSVYTSVQFVPKDKQSRVTRIESAL